MKKNFLYIMFSIIGVIIIALIIKLSIKPKVNNNLDTIKVSEVTHSIFYAPFYVAIENDYFKEENINIDLMLVSGSDNVAASVLSGDTLVGFAGPESALYVYNGKEKDYLQVFASLTKRDGQFILSRTNNFSWQDLIGKEILIGRSTGMPGLSFLKALENEGIDKSKVNINTSVEFAELAGSFIGGNGDFVNLFEPLATKIELNKEGYVVTSVGLSSNEFPYTAFYAKKSTIENNKDLIKRFTRAIKKGLEYTLNNDSDVIANIVKSQFSDTDVSLLKVMIDRYKQADVWLSKPNISEEFYNTLVNLLKENNLIKDNVPYKDLIINLDE